MAPDNGQTETAFGIRISKWNVKILIGILGVIFSGFTYLYSADDKIKEEMDTKVPSEMFERYDKKNTEAHLKLEDKLEDMEKVQNSTNLSVKRIETILEERLRHQ